VRVYTDTPDIGADEFTVTLIYPDQTISETNPVYSWKAVPGATQYRIYSTKYSDPNTPLVNMWFTKEQAGCASGTGTCSATPSVSLLDDTYRWWLQIGDGLGAGPWSTEMLFAVYTVPILPKTPVLVEPTGTVSESSPAYTWQAIPGTTSYRIYVADSSSPNTPVVNIWYTDAQAGCSSGVGQCTVSPSVTLPDAEYVWWIKGKNSVGEGPWSLSKTFKVITTTVVPGTPILLTPSGTVGITNPTYTWNAVPGATSYRIYVADQTNVNAPLVNVWYTAAEVGCASGTGTCSITPSVILPDAAYYWWVRAKNVAGQGPWSAYQTFTVITTTTIPDPPNLVSPSGTITVTTPTYTWNAVVGATSYRIYLTDSQNNIELNKWYTALQAGCESGLGTCSVTPATPLSNDSYSWRRVIRGKWCRTGERATSMAGGG